MPAVIERLREAINQHDPDAMVECFHPDYSSEQPAHPNRGFGGKDQVHKNWSGMFAGFPDLEARVLRQSVDGDVVWNEWLWSATGLQMAGVTVMGIREGRIAWARLYMEPVEQAGQDIDEAMRTITGQDRGDERQKSEG
jgi:ketosteroid isomerase-like protein